MSSCITTYSGISFDPLNPDPAQVRIYDIAHHLSNTCRFAGATSKFYSVAQHSLLVCALLPLDAGPWAHLLGLLHDAAEAYLTDLPTPVKHHTRFANFRTAEVEVQAAVESRLLIDEGCSYDELDDLWPLVKAADAKACFIEAKKFMPKAFDFGAPDPDLGRLTFNNMQAWPPPVAKQRYLEHYWDQLQELGRATA
jgi:hypothetical protein